MKPSKLNIDELFERIVSQLLPTEADFVKNHIQFKIDSYKTSFTKAVEHMTNEEHGRDDFSAGKIVAYDRVLNLITWLNP